MVPHPNIRSAHGSLFVTGTGDAESYTVQLIGFRLFATTFEWQAQTPG